MTGPRQRGSTSIVALALLILLAASSAGGATLLRSALSSERRSMERQDARLELESEADRILGTLAADPTPQSDSPLDPVWAEMEKSQATGISVKLRDLSSALNPNWVQKNVFQKTLLGDLFKPGRTPDELQQRREDQGFSTDLAAAYGDLFREGSLGVYFSAYGYPNLNITDEFALRKLYAIRAGDVSGAERFHAKIQDLLTEKKLLKREELIDFLGPASGSLYPLVNVEPTMNVHFVDPLVLSELLAYPDLNVPEPRQAAALIVNQRERSELTPEDLSTMIGAADGNRIYQYFGTITWFWKITVTREPGRLERIVARLPGAREAAAEFVVVEESYSR